MGWKRKVMWGVIGLVVFSVLVGIFNKGHSDNELKEVKVTDNVVLQNDKATETATIPTEKPVEKVNTEIEYAKLSEDKLVDECASLCITDLLGSDTDVPQYYKDTCDSSCSQLLYYQGKQGLIMQIQSYKTNSSIVDSYLPK
jgi:hypothetical protein